jgi:hypothetical protein
VGLAGALGAEQRSVVAVRVQADEVLWKVVRFARAGRQLEVCDHVGSGLAIDNGNSGNRLD